MVYDKKNLTGAEIIIQALVDNGVDTIFGYPGGAVLPIYDALFQQKKIKHVLVRHEQAALHAAEGYARSTGKVGCALVTSGPGATNAVTGLTDALLDSIPVVCFSGQVPTFLIGTDAFQEADTTGITRQCTKQNYLVKDVKNLAKTIHEAFHVAKSGRPGPVVIDLPKDVQFAPGSYISPENTDLSRYQPRTQPDLSQIELAVEMMASAKRPVFYTGGGVINSGTEAARLLTELVQMTGFPLTSTLMGLGAYPTRDRQHLGMLGMHGTYEANWAMHDCDVMVNIGARFDDRVTGRLDAFSPHSKKIHIDIDPSSINKIVRVELGIVSDSVEALRAMIAVWKKRKYKADATAMKQWWAQIDKWRSVQCLSYKKSDTIIKPQFALERLQAAFDKEKREVFVSTEVGQHQMWAAQFLKFEQPNHWMTSGGLGTMGYGLPAAIGVQMAHPNALVVDVAGDASILMNIQELSTAVQHKLPVKIFILNNQWMGMVKQWQELLHGERYSSSYTESLPDFVKLADAYGGIGFRVESPDDLDRVIKEMMKTDRVTIVDVCVDQKENCFPMIPSGKAHNEMILSADAKKFDKTLV
ncbi:MAG: acetolactate synthase 3 large subunit [Alphaproteobacteria bacterium]|nr:acetolactate synthase 3 large subunit [Alphaproteobacteria bacterium]MCB1551422.1 acetolactate synthase 3 large subunit [Alphaproteobacteria bacterium]MCB9985438.1 acetolactate synthase 3 large subunit [Micavibrio sp.]